MDVPTAAAWLLLGVVIGLLVAGAVAAAVAGRRRRRPRSSPPLDARDDLADFLAHPPGTRPAPPASGAWVPLATAPVVVDAAGNGPRPRATAGMCVAALALVGSVAAVSAGIGSRPDPPPEARLPHDRPAAAPGGSGGVAVLAFSGLVLEPHAVGVTAAYPEVRMTVDGDAARLDVRLPTYNCLVREPPADPLAAGCAAAAVEHGRLETDALRVEHDGDRWLLAGELATMTPAGGFPPEPTGRVYDLELTVSPQEESVGHGWQAAAGRLRLGAATATAVDGRSRLRAAD